MGFPIEKKLVVAVSSSALFDLSESDKVYNECGLEEYRRYQEQNIDNPLGKGVAFPFVKRLLSFNEIFADEQPVEVVLLSRNSPETGLRVFRTIKHYGLDITRASFFSGESPYKYLPAFNASLFLSASERDVKRACDADYAAGRVLKSEVMDDVMDDELRIAFDFDGVIAMAEKLQATTPALAEKIRIEAYNGKKDYAKVIALGETAASAQANEEDKSSVYFLVGAAHNAKYNASGNKDVASREKAIAALKKVTAGASVEAAKAALADLEK